MTLSVQTPVQIAWVTPSLDATEAALTGLLGAKKWVRMTDVHFAPGTCVYRGAPADFVAHISLSYVGDMQLELIQPVRGDSIYAEFLRENQAGLHHVCVRADTPEEFTAALDAAGAKGAEVVTRGVMAGGMEFAYLSAPTAGVPYVEIAYIPESIQSFFAHIKREQA
jgi:catechol 2,3-dioxygenase-like lactoylglutathione lyase family enzyme